MLAILFFDQTKDPPERAREIPVEVVTEPPPPEPKPAAPPTGGKSGAPPGDATQASDHEPQQKPETAAIPKSANEATSDPHPVEKSAAPQKPEAQAKSAGQQLAKSEPAAKGGQGAMVGPIPINAAHEATANNEVAHEQPPAAKPEAGKARQDGGSENGWAAETGLMLPFDTGPERFRAVAVPLPSESGGEAMSYKVIVFSLLARVKHYPEPAIQRGARGIAVIGFVLDDWEGSFRLFCCGRAATSISMRKASPWSTVPRPLPKSLSAWDIEFSLSRAVQTGQLPKAKRNRGN